MRKARAAYKTISVSFATISLMVFIAGCSHSHEGGTPEFVEEDRLWKPSPGLEGRIALASSNFDLAITRLTEAIRLDPKDAAAYFNRGVAYILEGEYDRALADYTEAIRLDPKNVEARINRGYLYG